MLHTHMRAWHSHHSPSIMCITDGGCGDFFTQASARRRDDEVAQRLLEVAAQLGIGGKVYVAHPSNRGGVVTRADPAFSSGLVTYNEQA